MGLVVEKRKIELGAAAAIAREIGNSLQGKPIVEAEIALLMAYFDGARGVLSYPEATRTPRAQILLVKAADAMVRLIAEVGAMSDDEVRRKSAGLVLQPPQTVPETSH